MYVTFKAAFCLKKTMLGAKTGLFGRGNCA